MLHYLYMLLGAGAATFLNDFRQQLQKKHCKGVPASIKIPIPKIENPSRYELIECEGTVGFMRAKFLVACGHWHQLKLTAAEKRTGFFDLMDHLHELTTIPVQRKVIGLVTLQNGICNTRADFNKKARWVTQNLPAHPLFIGLFNPSHGPAFIPGLSAIPDLMRLKEEWIANSETLCCSWRVFTTLADRLPSDKNLYWLHIAHSEAALLANLIIDEPKNSPEENSFFQKRLLTLTYGAVTPIPKRGVPISRNIYSSQDVAWHQFGEKFLREKEKYDIRAIKAISKNISTIKKLLEGDHDFLGETYKESLRQDINSIKKDYYFYAL